MAAADHRRVESFGPLVTPEVRFAAVTAPITWKPPKFGDSYCMMFDSRRFQRWRVFFLACAELFGYRAGREWIVAHYRFVPR